MSGLTYKITFNPSISHPSPSFTPSLPPYLKDGCHQLCAYGSKESASFERLLDDLLQGDVAFFFLRRHCVTYARSKQACDKSQFSQ